MEVGMEVRNGADGWLAAARRVLRVPRDRDVGLVEGATITDNTTDIVSALQTCVAYFVRAS